MKLRSPFKDIRNQLIFWMTILTISPLTLLFAGLFYWYYIPLLNNFMDFSRSILNRHLLVEQTSEAGQLAYQIGTFIRGIKENGKVIGRILSLDSLSSKEKNHILNKFLKSYSYIDCIISREINNRVRSAVQVGKTRSEQLATLVADAVLFQRTLAGEIAYSEPFVLPDAEELAMIVSMPVFNDLGAPLGALYFQVNLHRIQELTDEANRTNPGTIYVVDSEGKLLGHVDYTRVLQREDMTDLEIVRKYIQMQKTSGSIPYVNKQGQKVQGAYAPVIDMNWGVVAERSQLAAFSSVNEMIAQSQFTLRRLFLATLIGVISAAILAIAMGATLAVQITSPIREIAAGAIRIAKGDFSQRFHTKGSYEIEQLAKTLNMMSEEIERYTSDLQKYASDMRHLFKGSVESLVAAIDAKDPYTEGHSRRVTEISLLIGKELNLGKQQLEELEIAALMHDIGKIGIDDAILKKPSIVTDEERKILETHPMLGASIMKHIPMLKNMIPGMLQHHERWDGGGYPLGLKKNEISLYGRIIAVADTFDAMTSNRPYQKALSFDKAKELIENWKGTRYDPLVVQAFSRVYPEICVRISEVSVQSG